MAAAALSRPFTLKLVTLPVFEIIGLLLGLLLGSFLNVCIARIPNGESIVRPGSHCPRCQHPIRWYDNIPVLSWLILRARCRDCGAKISWQYPAVELASGLWGALSGFEFHQAWWASGYITAMRRLSNALFLSADALAFAVLGLFLIALIVIDWRTHRLPDAFTLTGIATGLFLVCTQTLFLLPGQDQIIFASKHLRLASPGSFAARGNVFLTGTEALIFGRLVAVCAAALILLAIRWTYQAIRHHEGLGLGDVKLLAMVAAFLGFKPALLTLFLGTLLATGYIAYLAARKRAHANTRLPFGSFLGVAGLFTAVFGTKLIGWYTSLFH